MWTRRCFGHWGLGLLGASALAGAHAQPAGWRDVLDTPARPSPLAARGLFNGLALAGPQVVAVGQRGHVLRSADRGQTWTQAEVPVSADLVAVRFPTATQGWAVGHDGVVLHSDDGGARWRRQLDGRQLGAVLTQAYQGPLAQRLGAADAAVWQAEAQRLAAQGADNPLLDVWFDDATTGYVVGAFGLALKTEDGGAHWQPFMHEMDNPKALHLYGLRRVGGLLYVVGEQGLVLRQDLASGRFQRLDLPYQGTLFGVIGQGPVVLVHGLRGQIWRSTDAGQHWQAVPTGLQAGITASAQGEGGALLLVSQVGHVLRSRDGGASFTPLRLARNVPAAAVLALPGGVGLLAGPRGFSVFDGA